MKKYKVWFIGTSNYAIIKASSRNIARILFADSHQVIVTSYIQARIAKQSEVQS